MNTNPTETIKNIVNAAAQEMTAAEFTAFTGELAAFAAGWHRFVVADCDAELFAALATVKDRA